MIQSIFRAATIFACSLSLYACASGVTTISPLGVENRVVKTDISRDQRVLVLTNIASQLSVVHTYGYNIDSKRHAVSVPGANSRLARVLVKALNENGFNDVVSQSIPSNSTLRSQSMQTLGGELASSMKADLLGSTQAGRLTPSAIQALRSLNQSSQAGVILYVSGWNGSHGPEENYLLSCDKKRTSLFKETYQVEGLRYAKYAVYFIDGRTYQPIRVVSNDSVSPLSDPAVCATKQLAQSQMNTLAGEISEDLSSAVPKTVNLILHGPEALY